MDSGFFTDSDQHLRRERQRAAELRRSRWWQSKIAKSSCYYCHRLLTPKEATMDHVVPLAEGGRSTPGNVVVACKPCNTKKGGVTAVSQLLGDLTGSAHPKPQDS